MTEWRSEPGSEERASERREKARELLYSDKAEMRKFRFEVMKGVWWMPRRKATMKDVAGCDKPR